MESPAKKKILDALAEATRHFAWNDLSDLSAQSLAEHFGLSRNLISQYLNEAHNEGLVIKINTRPVYFLGKAELCERMKAEDLKSVYDSVEELMTDQLAERENRFFPQAGRSSGKSEAMRRTMQSGDYLSRHRSADSFAGTDRNRQKLHRPADL